jgi:chorismate mutase
MDKLLEYRQEIDKIDSEIISLLAKRFEVVKLV